MLRLTITLLLATSFLGLFRSVSASDEPQPAWRIFLEWLRHEQQELTENLDLAHEILRQRAAAEDEEVLNRLSPEPPRPRPHGYGILPQIVDDEPEGSVPLNLQRYSLESLSDDYASDFRDAAILLRSLQSGSSPLRESADKLIKLEQRAAGLDDHLAYHESWQQSVIDYPDYFAARNRLHARMLQYEGLSQEAKVARTAGRNEFADSLSAVAANLRAEVAASVAPFTRTGSLRTGEGNRTLEVPIHTDIEDEEFLSRFVNAVESTLARGRAASSLQVKVRINRVRAAEIYDVTELPQYGESIDSAAHVERFVQQFGPSTLVLTTGAVRTVATIGRAVILGPENRSPRSLAHEFCHLLGFADAYLRAYEGDPNGRAGCTLVEWTGLQDDLMGSPSRGRVSQAMHRLLEEQYSTSQAQ